MMTTTKKKNKNPIESLASSIARAYGSHDLSSYLMLLQHSLLSPRQALWNATATEEDYSSRAEKDVYRRARVRTPLENAMRDASGHAWLQYLLRTFLAHDGVRILMLATETAASAANLFQQQHVDEAHAHLEQITVLQLTATDPWEDCIHDEEALHQPRCSTQSQHHISLDNLEALAGAVERHVQLLVQQAPSPTQQNEKDDEQQRPIVVLVMESLSPIFMRHGWNRTLGFVRRLHATLKQPMLVPVIMENFSCQQHQALEDLAQAVLHLHQGEMMLIRQGVRERGNTIRETVPFQFGEMMMRAGTISIEVVDDEETDATDAVDEAQPAAASISKLTHNERAAEETVAARRSGDNKGRPAGSKVTLRMDKDDESASRINDTTTIGTQEKCPRIFLQDDDPEFVDHDQEEPDDDLDI